MQELNEKYSVCPKCNGEGTIVEKIEVEENGKKIIKKFEEDCPICKGRGLIPNIR